MASALVSFNWRTNYLVITGHGVRDGVASMQEASQAIYEEVVKRQAIYLLVDYREVLIQLPMSEAFNMIKRYEQTMPFLKNTTIAVVFNHQGLAFGRYWQEVGALRGFNIHLFDNIVEAEKWLVKQLPQNDSK
jgi:hypothetical protein